MVLLLLGTTVRGTFLGQQLTVQFQRASSSLQALLVDTTDVSGAASAQTLLRAHPAHPSRTLSPYLDLSADSSAALHPSVLHDFHNLLKQYVHRQTTDDNFTVRVIDWRSHEVLELFEFQDLRSAFQAGRTVDWREVDQKRRRATRRLVDKYVERGVPREDIIVRWGRAQQIDAAQKRGRPYQAYEIQLATALDLSLLPTQMGVVETFNQDDLVSSAGARSRYQMLPWILRRSGVNEYTLPTAAGTRVEVEEALHPLLTLEPAFLLLRGYINAVGHEIPGLSAYHTGPGNIYKLYRAYLTTSNYYEPSSTVADAYAWAVTQGYKTVSNGSTFGSHSRGYVPSTFGALKARDQQPIDRPGTMRAVRTQVRPDTSVSLQTILTALDRSPPSLEWGSPAADSSSLYDKFRAFNPHLSLPASPDGSLPAAGNVTFVSTLDGKAVRFFLPLGAPEALQSAGLDVLAPALTRRYDDSTFAPPTEEQKTKWDRQYEALVDDIKHFGFTPQNRQQLLSLHDTFETLAENTPSPYRKRQLDIIRTHRRIWRSSPWETLSDLTMRLTGRSETPAEPPVDLQGDPPTSPPSIQ